MPVFYIYMKRNGIFHRTRCYFETALNNKIIHDISILSIIPYGYCSSHLLEFFFSWFRNDTSLDNWFQLQNRLSALMEECSRKENIIAQSLSKQSGSIATSARIQVKQPIPGHDGRDTQRGMVVPCITTSLSGIQCCLFWSLFFSSVVHGIKSLVFSFVTHFLRHTLIYMVSCCMWCRSHKHVGWYMTEQADSCLLYVGKFSIPRTVCLYLTLKMVCHVRALCSHPAKASNTEDKLARE